jgi:hypothetical protein
LKPLFSSQGVDVYMVGTPRPIPGGGVDALLVYQDEALRQQVIRFVRGPTPGVTITGGIRRPLDNLKFAILNFACDETVFFPAHGKIVWNGSRKCGVIGIKYYEPKECIVLPENPDVYQMQQLSMAGVVQRRDVMNSMNWLMTLEKKSDLPLYDDPILPDGHALMVKIVQALRAERKGYDNK